MRGLLDDSEFKYAWGLDELHEYVGQRAGRFYHAGLESFGEAVHALLNDHLQHLRGFTLKRRLRDLQVKHHQEIQAQAAALHEAQARFDQKYGEQHTRAQRAIESSEAAIRGISGALDRFEGDDPKLSALKEKLSAAQERQRLGVEELRTIHESEGWSALCEAQEAHRVFRERVGLTEAERDIQDHNQSRAKKSHSLGFSFEGEAVKCAHQLIIPQLIARREAERARGASLPALERSSIRVLTQVTLRAAQAELDVVIVQLPSDPQEAVTALAVIEAKRNPDDIAEGFMIRRENIAWFSGDRSGYDVERYTNKIYPEGHFDRGAWHYEQTDQQRYYFDERSFVLFRSQDEHDQLDRCPERLYFVTRARPLCDLPSGERALLEHYLATDRRFYTLSSEAMETLYDLMQRRRAHEMSTHDLMQRHYLNPERAECILMLSEGQHL